MFACARVLNLLLVIVAAWSLTACEEESPSVTASPGVPASLDTYFPLTVGEQTLRVQVPIKLSEQARGLMFRDTLGEDEGMLFPYPEPQAFGFWMKNVRFDLDIGFFDREGVLREIHQMYAGDEQTTRSQRSDLQYALEVNRGWFAAHGVRPGARLDLEQVRQALEARGADPADYGLAGSGPGR